MAIDCNTYDYIEIACLYHLPVTIKLRDNREVTGIAITTLIQHATSGQLNQETSKAECLVIKSQSGDKVNVVLENIVSLSCSQENKHFKIVNFTDGTVTK